MSSALLSVTAQLDQVEQNNHILAIDDDQAVLEYYREIFGQGQEDGRHQQIWGVLAEMVGEESAVVPDEMLYQLTTAESGESAIQLARSALAQQHPFTVAFVDMRMPGGMNGLETARCLREIDPRIIVVIVTAYSDHQIEEIQRLLGHDVLFLNKPLSVDEMSQAARMLNQSWKEREKNKVLEMQMVSHAKMAALGNMATRIGHEINQPLSYINGILQLQKMELESGNGLDLEQCASEVDLALEQTVRIKEIIDSLRVFAHPGKEQRGGVSLSESVGHVQRMFHGRLEAQRVTLRVGIDPQLPSLHANASQLQRILTNLTSNAIDALSEQRENEQSNWQAEIVLQARYREVEQVVEITFADNGVGIPESIRHRMFDPFVTTKEPGKGTGLGLSEIHGMLKEHGASIEYAPLEDQPGARFVILFPVDGEVEDE